MSGIDETHCCQLTKWVVGVGVAVVVIGSYIKYRKGKRLSGLREKWNRAGKDVVVLHQFERARFGPNLSPYPIKLELWMRMYNIKYVCDFDEPMSTQHKSPWITINGVDVADSQVCIEYLAKKFDVDSEPESDYEKAVARGMRFMIEQDFYWCLVMDRWVYNKGQRVVDFAAPFTPFRWADKLLLRMISGDVYKQAWQQGMGRREREDVEKMGLQDLQCMSDFLGTKQFMMGDDRPSVLDCTLFGFLCMLLFASPKDNLYTRKVEKDLHNLRQYTDRIIDRFWPDWKQIQYRAK